MKTFVEGDKSKAFCFCCSDIVQTTFFFRNVPFSDGRGTAVNILVGVCDNCNGVVAMPSQSIPAIAQARASHGKAGSG